MEELQSPKTKAENFPENSQKTKTKSWRISLPNVKIYYKATEIKYTIGAIYTIRPMEKIEPRDRPRHLPSPNSW